MSIVQVVLDLPLEGVFDYSVPKTLQKRICVGMRVRVPFNNRLLTGFVVGEASHSEIKDLKPIKRVIDGKPVIDAIDINLAREFSSYYGVSLGESLTSLLRDVDTRILSKPVHTRQSMYCHEIVNGKFESTLDKIVAVDSANKVKTVVCVPDHAYIRRYKKLLSKYPQAFLITRSQLHQTRGAGNVIVIDEDNPSYAQEQTPKYHARQLVLMMSKYYGFHVHFIGVTPSVELRHMVEEGRVKLHAVKENRIKPMVVDVNIYQNKGVLTPASLALMESVLKANGKVLVLLNRRGNYAITKCKACEQVVQCTRCQTGLVFDKSKNIFMCSSCAAIVDAHGLQCAQCGKTEFKSVGVGVSQLKVSIAKLFPLSTIGSYQHDDKPQPTPHESIVIATQAILSLQDVLTFDVAIILDIDRELNRQHLRSTFDAWALVEHLRVMSKQVVVQTRQPAQDMLVALARDDRQMFYANELNVRRELGFSPFGHWIRIVLRYRDLNLVQEIANHMYAILSQQAPKAVVVHPVSPDVIAKQRDQYRMSILVQGQDVVEMISLIKKVQLELKRVAHLYITLQVD